ncbi:sulfatase-like hydrolase/transferase [Maribacter polysaccharolyticus]|uniref:sulfatase-like hydrolase/transferase n=1 Tax=Maribacter polysaccharolyticus TaxID=3020831 RepID=UPI00237F35DA|nr:sulfatase-like hydrolase/transferase [Maribacter polysaccharolyticus]MDE3740979.1 sulfatase-like hydrolase/transferase [Maribacter polysaccharolyticus]
MKMTNKSLLIICLLVIGAVSFKVTAQNSKPNVLFIFADDQRADAMGCSGNTYIQTPNIDKLAQNGVRFTNSYVMGGHHGAICAPSRAMLMSGKSLFHVYDKLDGVKTMPMHFAENGYETFGTGKWHNKAPSFEAGFQYGSNVFIGGMADHFNTPMRDLGKDGKLSEPVKKGYSTDLFADAAIDYINGYAQEKKDRPFFCYIAFTAPHDPRSPREDYIGMYPDESMPLPGNFKALHPFKFDNLNIRDETLGPWPRTPELIKSSLADYYALISHMDNRIGDVINTLKEQGLYDNTIIVYAADNGLAIGSHGLLGKQDLYEHSTKVPLIISGPGVPKSETRDAFLYLFDIYPTLAELCNLPEPTEIDGKNFTSVLAGKETKIRESLYTAYRHTARAVRTEDWKLIRYPERDYTQLYNLKKDPLEIRNLAELDAYESVVENMLLLLADWHASTDDTANLNPSTILPLEYDYKKLMQIPDDKQPKYILDKYFQGVDLKTVKKTGH